MNVLDPRLVWLVVTVALEIPIALLVLRRARLGVTAPRVRAILAVNLVSFPLALEAVAVGVPWLPVEIAVTVAEAFGLRALLGTRVAVAFGAAIAANLVSAAAGLVLSVS